MSKINFASILPKFQSYRGSTTLSEGGRMDHVLQDLCTIQKDGTLKTRNGIGHCRDKYQCYNKENTLDSYTKKTYICFFAGDNANKDGIERIFKYINDLEEFYGFSSVSVMHPVSDKEPNLYVVEGSPEWLTSGLSISLYSLLLRAMCNLSLQSDKAIVDWNSFLERLSNYEKGNPGVSFKFKGYLLVKYFLETFRDVSPLSDIDQELITDKYKRDTIWGISGFLESLDTILTNSSDVHSTRMWFMRSPKYRAQAKPIIDHVVEHLEKPIFVESYNKIPVFVYGSLKRGHVNNPVMNHANGVFVDDAVLYGETFALINLTSSYPAVISRTSRFHSYFGSGYRIYGEFWAVEDINVLDRLEGHPNYYTRMVMDAAKSDKVYTRNLDHLMYSAYVYVLTNENRDNIINRTTTQEREAMLLPAGRWPKQLG